MTKLSRVIARDFLSKKGAELQQYFVYCKILQRIFGGKDPQSTAGTFDQRLPRFTEAFCLMHGKAHTIRRG